MDDNEEYTNTDRLQCDGRTPICGTCESVGALCTPSDRLVIRQIQPDSERDMLHNQLKSLQQQHNSLLLRFEQLQAEIGQGEAQTVPDVPLPGPLPTPNESLPGRQTLNLDISYSGRILQPTFTRRRDANNMNWSALSSAWDLWGDDSTPTDVFRSTNIPLDLGDDAYRDLTNTFFDCRWSYLPVLHRPTFVNEHLNPFLSKSVTSPISVFLVNMVCAIATTEKSSFQEDSQVHRSFFNRAVQDLHIVMGIDDLQCVQCLLLLCMYGHNEPQSVNMCYTTGLALQLAIGMDLHRKESLWGHSLLCTEIFKRIFWCSYVMNCNMAINMGRPLGIHESDITMPLPLPLTDDQLSDSCVHPDLCQTTISQTSDISAFIHIIQLRKINAAIYKSFHPIGRILLERQQLDAIRRQYFSELNNWLVTSPRYPRPSSTFQTTEWFQIAFHHATLSLYRPSRAIPMPSSEDLGICMESAIGLISSYSSLYARNRIKYTFVAIHSLFMAAVAMLYALRVSLHLRQELTRPVVQTNILTFLTLFRGISNGRPVGERCAGIIERLGDSILSLFDDAVAASDDVDTEFQSWFGLQTQTLPTPTQQASVGGDPGNASPQFPEIDVPWADLFTEGIDMGSTDVSGFFC